MEVAFVASGTHWHEFPSIVVGDRWRAVVTTLTTARLATTHDEPRTTTATGQLL